MRKLLDDRLVKIIDRMGDTPYEYYKFENTPMTTLTVESVEPVSTGANTSIYLSGEIEPYTKLYVSGLDLGLKAHTSGRNVIQFHFPNMIEEDFEIYFYFDDIPEGVWQLHYAIYFDDDFPQYFLYNNEDGSQPTGFNLAGYGNRDGVEYSIYTVDKYNPGTEESLRIQKINGIMYITAASI